MDNLAPLKLLLKHPILNTYTNIPIKSDFIHSILGYELALPNPTNPKPFLFSCFALSQDGKLNYPDAQSGFSIALANHAATVMEKNGDLFSLMLARCISDAIIVGTKSIEAENGNYLPLIAYPQLNTARQINNKLETLITIVICQSLANINFMDKLFTDSTYPVIIACFDTNSTTPIPGYFITTLSKLSTQNQHQNKMIIQIDRSISTLFEYLHGCGIKIILNESPFFHHYALEHKLLDEAWINYSLSYIGGSMISLGNNQKSFNCTNHPDSEILSLHHLDYHFLYSRQRIIYN